MTSTTEEKTDKEAEQKAASNTDNIILIPPLPQEIMDIMKSLSANANIVFKSQQRDEPELHQTEKLKVALEVYQRNPQTFLIRFGNYLEEKHLLDFAKFSIADSDEEMHLLVKDYQTKLKTHLRDVKNRRYAALQKLIKEGEYFSEQEMMKRQPELYQELVGQYLTSKEKEQRDSYDVKNTTFSGILMHKLEQKQLSEIMEKAEQQIKSSTEPFSEDSVEKGILYNFEKDAEVPFNCRQQWGNFENEQIACSSSKVEIKKSSVRKNIMQISIEDLITADERQLLRQEFISQMHEQFLTGQDEDFDYATVDENTQYDDLNLINQDKEDKYFEESDTDDDEEVVQRDEGKTTLSRSPHKMVEDVESEDELDIYMSHLNKHHSLQTS